jgi:hypothetical protein
MHEVELMRDLRPDERSVPRWLVADLGVEVATSVTSHTPRKALRDRSRRRRFPKAVELASLERVPLFAGLSGRQRRAAARLARPVTFPANAVLARQGTPPEAFLVVLDGRVDVQHHDRIIGFQGPGSHAGAPAIMANRHRTTTLVAATTVRGLVVDRPQFERLLEEVPPVSERLLADLGRSSLAGIPTDHAA